MKYDLFVDASGVLASEFRFLSKAISDDETRYFMNQIHIEYIDAEKPEAGLLAVATDGRRLHIVEPLGKAGEAIFGMKPGFYRFLKGTPKGAWLARLEEDPGQFPNWRRVLPDVEPKFTAKYSGFTPTGRQTGLPDLVRLLRSLPEATAMNLKYLADLGTDDAWEAQWTEPNKAVVFKSGNKKAVIMPLQMDQ